LVLFTFCCRLLLLLLLPSSSSSGSSSSSCSLFSRHTHTGSPAKTHTHTHTGVFTNFCDVFKCDAGSDVGSDVDVGFNYFVLRFLSLFVGFLLLFFYIFCQRFNNFLLLFIYIFLGTRTNTHIDRGRHVCAMALFLVII